jgi:hypothetical protein
MDGRSVGRLHLQQEILQPVGELRGPLPVRHDRRYFQHLRLHTGQLPTTDDRRTTATTKIYS